MATKDHPRMRFLYARLELVAAYASERSGNHAGLLPEIEAVVPGLPVDRG